MKKLIYITTTGALIFGSLIMANSSNLKSPNNLSLAMMVNTAFAQQESCAVVDKDYLSYWYKRTGTFCLDENNQPCGIAYTCTPDFQEGTYGCHSTKCAG